MNCLNALPVRAGLGFTHSASVRTYRGQMLGECSQEDHHSLSHQVVGVLVCSLSTHSREGEGEGEGKLRRKERIDEPQGTDNVKQLC